MMTFEVGKRYYPYHTEYGAVLVERRTQKTIWVEKDGVRWSMRCRVNANDVEYAVDTSVPKRDRDLFTYFADNED